MRLHDIGVAGAFVIEPDARLDHRGAFSRLFCQKQFSDMGLCSTFVQCNESRSESAGTLRGLHYQVAPHEEVKLVRCIRGAIFDVLVDLRPDSSTYRQWAGVRLSAESRQLLYVPAGCAHGYLALVSPSGILYQSSQFYEPSAERGLRWNDPAIGIQWPRLVSTIVSEKDRAWPDYAA